LLVGIAVVALLQPVAAQPPPPPIDTTGEANFKTAGFPTICFLFGTALVIWACHTGYSVSGAADTRSPTARVFLAIQILVLFGAIFFVFGPGHISTGGPAANILGLLFWFSASLGFYAHFTDSNNALLGWFILAVVELLGLMGLLPLIGLGSAITNLNQIACLTYFQEKTLDRCDNGYLQLLRTWGMFLIFALAVGVVQTLPRLHWSFSNTHAPSAQGYSPVGGGGGGNPGPYSESKPYQPPSQVTSAPIRTPMPGTEGGPQTTGGFQADAGAQPRTSEYHQI